MNKVSQLSKAYFQRDPGFNTEAAYDAYTWAMHTDPDVVQSVLPQIVFDSTARDLLVYGDEIQAHLDTFYTKQMETVRKSLVRSYVAKRSDNHALEHLEQMATMATAIAKADDEGDYTEYERRLNAKRQLRDSSGRFRVMTRKISYPSGLTVKPMPDKYEEALKIRPSKEAGLSASQRANYQHAYQQLASLLAGFDNLPPSDVVTTLHYRSHDGKSFATSELGNSPTSLDPHQFRHAKLEGVQVAVANDLSVGGASYDLMGALGAPGSVAAHTIGVGNRLGDQITPFRKEWLSASSSDKYNPNAQAYRRLQAGARVLNALIPDVPGFQKVKVALAAAEFAGQHGTEVESVVGPGARKAAYRYRGIETTPDKGLQSVVDNARRSFRNDEIAREYLVYGYYGPNSAKHKGSPVGISARSPEGNSRVLAHPGAEKLQGESPLVAYLDKRLTDPRLMHLQRKSGTIPPSEGIIIDRYGKIASQAVGYGEDWYLPFNLKNLSKLNGGEYIRTRAYGGPTTEDIYAGLTSGARALTVVSHNGTYTIEFDDRFRGSRRYSDKAARMVNRYGKLLDAVKSGQVELGSVDPERMTEIRAKANEMYSGPFNEARRKEYVEREVDQEKANPQLSETTKAGIRRDLLLDHFGSEEALSQAVTHLQATSPATNPDLAEFYLLGQTGQTNAYEALVAQRQAEYKSSLSPLRLNGEGYGVALEALQEQFPYYIKDVKFRPKGPGTDYGYVKPKFIRPAGVTEGYFDPTISGGPLRGDQLYNQNNIRARGDSHEEQAKPSSSFRRVEGQERTQFGAMAASASKQKAYTELLAAMRDAPLDRGNGKPMLSKLQEFAPNLYGPEDTLLAQWSADPEGTRVKVAEQLKKIRDLKFNGLPEEQIRAFESGEPSSALRNKVEPFALDKFFGGHQRFDFGPDYQAAPGVSPLAYEDAFAKLNVNGLPQRLGDPAFEQAVSDQMSALRKEWANLPEEVELANDISPTKAEQMMDDFTERATKLAKARQLNVLHRAATKSLVEESAAADAGKDQVIMGHAVYDAGQGQLKPLGPEWSKLFNPERND